MTVLAPILMRLIGPQAEADPEILPLRLTALTQDGDPQMVGRHLNAAFLIVLAGKDHPDYAAAQVSLEQWSRSERWGRWARFYRQGAKLIADEVTRQCQADPQLQAGFEAAAAALQTETGDGFAIANRIWSVLFPDGSDIHTQPQAQIDALRAKRTVKIDHLNPAPLEDVAQQLLFTSNVLLTTPLPGSDLTDFDADLQAELALTAQDTQRYWYDHPIPVGVAPDANEILYGLKHLNAAVQFEQQRHPDRQRSVNCVLSVSVTHERLQTLGKAYLKQVLAASPPLTALNIFAFTEADTLAIRERILLPIVERCCATDGAATLLSIFGVDGRYGRHYSFLKAIAALWQVLIDTHLKATFKIDLDQVFPQPDLVAQTGASAFEHFQTPLWGATGEDATGQPVELGMLAGALVNQSDIDQGLFTPDVTFPDGELKPDEYVFLSRLPQAVSTAAEMMTRYAPQTDHDGQHTGLERIHVTGGTNGILVDSLRRHRPFTPSFIARAEDQAYILSVLGPSQRLAYAHAAGLIMRHDKEGFAQDAIAMAKVGKQIGDYLRILMFSAYAEALAPTTQDIKALSAPFTGCFISQLPTTLALLRFALKIATLFQTDHPAAACEYIETGIPQLQEGLDFCQGSPSPLAQTYQQEQQGWQLYYDCLTHVEQAIQAGEDWASEIQAVAHQIVQDCRVN